jgi:hypothetical protein
MIVTYFELALDSGGANGEAFPGDAARNCGTTCTAVGRDGSVGIATHHGLNGPGIESL